jgi:hypothetical protein
MEQLALQVAESQAAATPMTDAEWSEYNDAKVAIREGTWERNKATSKIMAAISNILRKNLYREEYTTRDEFLMAELQVSPSQATRLVNAHEDYAFLMLSAEDETEEKTLSSINESTFRVLRKHTTEGISFKKTRSETQEEYEARVNIQKENDREAMKLLWKYYYKNISQVKTPTAQGNLPTTASDIEAAAKVFTDALSGVTHVGGKTITIDQIAEVAVEKNMEPIEVSKTFELAQAINISEEIQAAKERRLAYIKESIYRKFDFLTLKGRMAYSGGEWGVQDGKIFHPILPMLIDKNNMEVEITIKYPVREINVDPET